MFKLPMRESGQALLIVVLSLAVVLTVVLSILARSVTDIKLSTGSEESLRAFSAAEAGIERALIAGSGTVTCDGVSCLDYGGASLTASVTEVGEGDTSFANPTPILSGETALFWFVAHDADGSLTCSGGNNCFTGSRVDVCWGKDGTGASSSTTPAVEISVIYSDPAVSGGDYSNLKVARETADPYAGRLPDNSFSAPSAGGCSFGGEDFEFKKTLNFTTLGIPATSYNNENGLQYLVVRMLYNTVESHTVGVSVPAGLLPAQGTLVESSGTSGEANRKINVFQGFGEPPLPFGAVIFSPTGITK